MRSTILVIGATNTIELTGLQNTSTGDYIRDADVKASLYDQLGVPVAGAQNIPMTYVLGTDGKDTLYRGAIPSDVPLQQVPYTVVITATDTALNKRPFTIRTRAVVG